LCGSRVDALWDAAQCRGMSRPTWRIFACTALLLGSCAGGQTGEPGGLQCQHAQAPANVAIDAVTPAEVGRALAGQYRAQIAWFEGTPGESSDASVAATDELSIVVTYDGADGERVCDALLLEVDVEIMTRELGVLASGPAQLGVSPGTRNDATLLLVRNGLSLRVRLVARESSRQLTDITVQLQRAGMPDRWAELR
jgi:hypothetical protein